MSEKKQRIQTKTIRVGFGKGKLNRLLSKGWMVANTKGGELGSAQTITLTRMVEK